MVRVKTMVILHIAIVIALAITTYVYAISTSAIHNPGGQQPTSINSTSNMLKVLGVQDPDDTDLFRWMLWEKILLSTIPFSIAAVAFGVFIFRLALLSRDRFEAWVRIGKYALFLFIIFYWVLISAVYAYPTLIDMEYWSAEPTEYVVSANDPLTRVEGNIIYTVNVSKGDVIWMPIGVKIVNVTGDIGIPSTVISIGGTLNGVFPSLTFTAKDDGSIIYAIKTVKYLRPGEKVTYLGELTTSIRTDSVALVVDLIIVLLYGVLFLLTAPLTILLAGILGLKPDEESDEDEDAQGLLDNTTSI